MVSLSDDWFQDILESTLYKLFREIAEEYFKEEKEKK